ncbi:hypothetical protein [Planosporangium mesophilum]|uniref:Secreted protein n=1 Tax=Planosporangium mesophilum TaxID=689768 RepID=A0A8J3TE13_9ACTN|nr:hypothetical protein [Planosporangium mesophilum]NJC84242.1 hypothetical protein [Planosporangium mesophilum]GII23084.1 hypothetical protein Pme01_26810 [Planosporangium mesophilum]
MEEETKSALDRRRLLRSASAVAAGVGAAGVASALTASPAQAAPGEAVKLGAAVINDGGAETTVIKNSSATGATLELTNSANGPSLRLAPSSKYMPADVAPGSFNATAGGELEFQATADIATLVNTSYTATQTWPVTPFRALDTRGLGGVSGNGRELILNPDVLGPSGLRAGQTLLLNLTPFVNYGWAVLGNATVQGPEANGFVTIAPAGVTRPNTSSINFLKGWPLSNAIVCALGESSTQDPNQSDVIQIYASCTTHLIFDVTGFVVASLYNINPSLRPFTPASSASVSANSTRKATRADRVRAYKPKR